MENKKNVSHKIVSFSPYLKEVNDAIERLFPGVQLETALLESTEEEKLKMVRDATILFGDYRQRNRIDRNIIEEAKNLKLIQQPTVGYEAIDVEAASENGVPVANTAGFNSVGVAEHALMMALALLKKLPRLQRETCNCNWLQVQCVSEGSVWELEGRTLGILGFGLIGRELAKRARGFGPRILYNKRSRLTEAEEKELGVEYSSFEDILSRSDILSVHVPLSEETRGLIGRDEIARMKKGAILLNLARGEVVDAWALADAVKEGRLSGAGVDVFDPEPISPGNPLIGLENVILTPHIAGATAESKLKSLRICFENFARVMRGERPAKVVNN
jgi:phosphoglycerate dehydrogenase-like enzyme